MMKSIITLLFFLSAGYVTAQEVAPTPLNLAEISSELNYPDSAKANKIEGQVVFTALLDANGNIEKLSDKIEGPEIFHDEVKRVIRRLKFSPARKDGEPVKCWVSIPFKFELNSFTEPDIK